MLVQKVSSLGPPDVLEVEELALLLAERLVQASIRERARLRDRPLRPRACDLAEAERLRGQLSAEPGRRHRLDTLARQVGSTPFHLCRSFRRATGTTIHRYLTQVRLHKAIDRLADGSPDLSEMALNLGFSSHSHFTALFRKHLGVPPEEIRRAARGGDILALRRRLACVPTAAGT
jgi:AraC-like DNA-binding protein